MTIEVRPATTEDLDEVRELFREYAAGLGFELEFQAFEQELAALPGRYAPPRGRLLLAVSAGQAIGCVALRQFELDVCEMKRLYLRPAGRRQHLGRALAERIIAEARAAGYRRMRLDTVSSMQAAGALYRSLGFREIEPYCFNPIPGATFLELEL